MESIRCPFWEHDALQTARKRVFSVSPLLYYQYLWVGESGKSPWYLRGWRLWFYKISNSPTHFLRTQNNVANFPLPMAEKPIHPLVFPDIFPWLARGASRWHVHNDCHKRLSYSNDKLLLCLSKLKGRIPTSLLDTVTTIADKRGNKIVEQHHAWVQFKMTRLQYAAHKKKTIRSTKIAQEHFFPPLRRKRNKCTLLDLNIPLHLNTYCC